MIRSIILVAPVAALAFIRNTVILAAPAMSKERCETP